MLVFCFSTSLQAQDSLYNYHSPFEDKLDLALKGLKMTRADLSLRDDYLEKDDYRLDLIDSLMQDPLVLITLSQKLLSDEALNIREFCNIKQKQALSVESRNISGLMSSEDYIDSYIKPEMIDTLSLYCIAYFLTKAEKLRSLKLFDKQYESLLDSIVYGFTVLLEENIEDESRTIDELDSIQNYEDEWAEALAEITNRVQIESIGLMGQDFLDVFNDSVLNNEEVPQPNKHYIEFNSPYGNICIGDSTAQNYSGNLFIVIDYGGDDTYNIEKTGTGNFTFIFDYGGSDTYNLPQNRISPYALGANIIIDYAGDDYYNAGSWTLGAGLFGIGILWDKKGNDRYFGDTFTMGAGCFGYGILRDDRGDDLYQGALFCQGFGFVRGMGVLLDGSGNDHYFAGGKYKDILRYKDHYLSLSQGFAYGLRPYMSGGVGYLIDKSGNDTYESDIFGQGCSYWWSLGILTDGGGNDKYLSFQYAQGSATHMTLGCLYDDGGDDFYLAKGVSQGCGHDWAAGILYDVSGNDNYMAHDLSQGAGSANGIGLIADLSGLDSYMVKKALNTQGYGNPRRDYGSIGIFLDVGGEKDSYAGGNGNDSTWWSGSTWGIGLDE